MEPTEKAISGDTKDGDIIKYKGYSITKIYPSKQFEVTHDGSLITREDTLEEAKSAIDKRKAKSAAGDTKDGYSDSL